MTSIPDKCHSCLSCHTIIICVHDCHSHIAEASNGNLFIPISTGGNPMPGTAWVLDKYLHERVCVLNCDNLQTIKYMYPYTNCPQKALLFVSFIVQSHFGCFNSSFQSVFKLCQKQESTGLERRPARSWSVRQRVELLVCKCCDIYLVFIEIFLTPTFGGGRWLWGAVSGVSQVDDISR